MAMTTLQFKRSFAGDQTAAIEQGYVDSFLLTASTAKEVTIPTGARYAIFSADADIWVRMGAEAAIPAGDTVDGTASELNPEIRWVENETTISIISEQAAKVSIAFHS